MKACTIVGKVFCNYANAFKIKIIIDLVFFVHVLYILLFIEEIPVLFLEQFILTPKTPLKHFQELANKLKVNHTEYNKICLSEKDKPEVKKIALMKLIKNVIITKRMSLFKVACKIVESGPKLCRIAFHTSSPYPSNAYTCKV